MTCYCLYNLPIKSGRHKTAYQQWPSSSYRHWGSKKPAGLSVFRECPYIGSHLRREGAKIPATVAEKNIDANGCKNFQTAFLQEVANALCF